MSHSVRSVSEVKMWIFSDSAGTKNSNFRATNYGTLYIRGTNHGTLYKKSRGTNVWFVSFLFTGSLFYVGFTVVVEWLRVFLYSVYV